MRRIQMSKNMKYHTNEALDALCLVFVLVVIAAMIFAR